MHNKTETDKVIELVRWLAEHPKVQRRLCEDEYKVTPEEFIEIMELLEQHEFYEMIVVLILKNRCNAVLSQALSRMLVETMSKEWEKIGTKQMCKDMKDLIREEIRSKEAGGSRL